MDKKQFNNLRIGDTVIVTIHGQNKGKIGVVEDIVRFGGYGTAYLRPVGCEFGFSNPRKKNKDSLYGFTNSSIQIIKPGEKKKFYVAEMFGGEGRSWSADNFNTRELKIIERFLEEFNERSSPLFVESIHIFEDDDEEE